MRRTPSFVLGMLVGSGLLGTGLLLGGADDRADQEGIADVLRAREVEIVDEIGTVRLVLGTNAAGGTMSVRDKLGRTILLASASEQGGAIAIRSARTGRPAFMAGAARSGGAVQVFDEEGMRVFDVLAEAGRGRLTVASRGGEEGDRPAVRLEADETGAGILTGFGPSGRASLRLFTDTGGNGVMETYHEADAHPLVTISSTVGGHGQIRTSSPAGAPLVLLTATAENEGQVYTFAADARPMVALASRPAGPTVRIYNRDGKAVISLESDEEGNGAVGVWRPDGSGRTFTPGSKDEEKAMEPSLGEGLVEP